MSNPFNLSPEEAALVEGLAAKRRGRPPSPEGERRDETIRLRVTEAEHAALTEAARDAGLTVSDYLRGLAGLRERGA